MANRSWFENDFLALGLPDWIHCGKRVHWRQEAAAQADCRGGTPSGLITKPQFPGIGREPNWNDEAAEGGAASNRFIPAGEESGWLSCGKRGYNDAICAGAHPAELGVDQEGLCVIRTTLKRTARSMKLAGW